MMMRIFDATCAGGVLKPDEQLPLREHQRVRVIIQAMRTPQEREQLFEQFKAQATTMNFRSEGRYPTRDEFHERG
jgi:predicted DNA-binding antitoxin AbrB/MazE fold protein